MPRELLVPLVDFGLEPSCEQVEIARGSRVTQNISRNSLLIWASAASASSASFANESFPRTTRQCFSFPASLTDDIRIFWSSLGVQSFFASPTGSVVQGNGLGVAGSRAAVALEYVEDDL